MIDTAYTESQQEMEAKAGINLEDEIRNWEEARQ